MLPTDEFDRTLVRAEAALEHMRRLRLPPEPRNYTLWYNFVAQVNPALVDAVNLAMSSGPAMSEQDAALLYDAHLAIPCRADHYDKLGERVRSDLEGLARIVEASRQALAHHSNALSTFAASGAGADVVAETMDHLLQLTRDMKAANAAVETQLERSREEMQVLQHNLEVIRAEALIDSHTQLASRSLFDLTLSKILVGGQPFALLITDIDHFKSFNDRFGHLTGDHVLRLVAEAVRSNVRGGDIAARYGGEEFAVIMPNTDLAAALAVAERIRHSVMRKELVQRSTGENLGRVTISVGASASRADDNRLSIVDRADACLYAAKRGGRNQVVSETDSGVLGFGNRVA